MSNKLKIKKKFCGKIAINKECFLLTDIIPEKGRVIKKGQVIHVVDAFIEYDAIGIAFKYKGDIVEALFTLFKKLPRLSKTEFIDKIESEFIFPVLRKEDTAYIVVEDNKVITHYFTYSAPVLE